MKAISFEPVEAKQVKRNIGFEPVEVQPVRKTPISFERVELLEPTAEDLEIYRKMGVEEYRSPSGKMYDLGEPQERVSERVLPTGPSYGQPPAAPGRQIPLSVRMQGQALRALETGLDVAHGLGARVQYLNLKLLQGLTFNAPEIITAVINRVKPDLLGGENFEEATLKAAQYDPSGFMKVVGEVTEFIGRLKSGHAIGKQLGLLGGTPKSIGTFGKALEAAKLGLIAGTGEQISLLALENIDPDTDYGYEGAIGPVKDAAILAAFSVGTDLLIAPALAKVAATKTGQAIIKSMDDFTRSFQRNFPRFSDMALKKPPEAVTKEVAKYAQGRGAPPFEKMTAKQQAFVRHVAREWTKKARRMLKAYQKDPTPDIVRRAVRPKAPLQITGAPQAPTVRPVALPVVARPAEGELIPPRPTEAAIVAKPPVARAVEGKVAAFHGTRADIDTFKPLSHFGTQKAAEQALESIKGKGEAKVVSVELTLKNPLEVKDTIGVQEDVVDWVWQAEEKGVVTEKEASTIEDIVTETGEIEEAETAFVKLLKSKGYDGLKYINRTEDKGSISYVVFDPKQVKIAKPPAKGVAGKAVEGKLPTKITSGYPPTEFEFTGRWSIQERRARHIPGPTVKGQLRKKRKFKVPIYRSAKGEEILYMPAAVEITTPTPSKPAAKRVAGKAIEGKVEAKIGKIDISPEMFKESELTFLNQKAVDAMTKAFREGDETILNRPIAVVPDGKGGISIVEGHNRAAAAKKAGVKPPVVIVALDKSELEGMDAPEVDALAKKILAEPAVEGKVEEQNFTVFAREHGYTDDYSVLEHGDLSPSGRRSKRSHTASMRRMEERIESNKAGHEAYRKAILEGKIIDPDGVVTKEGLLAAQKEGESKKIEGRLNQIRVQIQMLKAVGKGKRGTIKPSYQKRIDELEAERKQLTEPAVEGKVIEPVEPEPEVEVRDLSEKTRKRQIKQTEDAISEHGIYQLELEGIEAAEAQIGPGYYYVTPALKGEVLSVTGKPGQKGFKPQLYKSFTFESGTIATSWAKAAQIAGLDDIDISEFVRRVDEAIESRKKVGALNERALERAIRSRDQYFELLAMKREMLKDGLSAAEVNDNIKQQADHYDLPQEGIADLLVPVERVEYVEKKPRVAEKVARKGRQVKAKLSPEETAINKAKTVAHKINRPAYVYQKAGRFVVSKNPPATGPYSEVSPLEKGQIVHKVTAKEGRPKGEARLVKEPGAPMATDAQKARGYTIAKEKGLISVNDKPTQSYRRFARAMTGKTSMEKMTPEEADHFVAMLDALTTDYHGIAKIPTSKHIITEELADKIGKFKNIGALEKVRPAWRVFEKIGLTKEVFEPAFEAEISSIEELFAFREQAKKMQKLVGKDKAISQKLFRAMENPGTVKLTDNEKKVVEWGKKFFADWADRLRLSPESRRKKYITHIFEREIAQSLREKHPLDPDLVRALDFITPKTIFNPFLQKRLGRTVGLKENFWVALEAYENKAIKKFYYEPLIKRIRVYERFLPPNSARYLRSYITRITGRPLTIDREVNQTLKEVAREISKLPGGKQLAQYLTKGNASAMLAYNMTGIYYECWLGLRPASAIKNLSQHGLILAETGPVAFAKALKVTGAERAALLANSKVLRSRKLGYLPGIDQTFINSLESKRRKVTMAMFRAADRKNVSDAFLAGYWEAKAKGLPDEWAYKRGDEVAAKTQWLYSKLAGSQLMQSSPGRVLGVLTTWPENWAELMNDWMRAKPSQVFADYAKETGEEMPKVNWVSRRKALWSYLTLVSLAMLIHKKTPFKALYYTGWTSIKSLVDIASGKLAGLEIPRIIGNFIVGLALGDKRRLKQSWNETKRFVVIAKELYDIITGKKDWMSLFIYLETEKEKAEKRPTRPTRPKRPTRPTGKR